MNPEPKSPLLPLIAVLGPTGSGKSELALQLAESFGGEVVNYDSVQLYRGLDIGSAKIPHAQRRSIPHNLLDIAGVDQDITAGAFVRLAREVLTDLAERKKLPVLVGGTGFYLRALLAGLSPAPGRNSGLRNRLEQVAVRRPEALHRLLRKQRSQAADRIHPNDHQKLIRAIELASCPDVTAPRQALEGYTFLKVGLCPERSELNRRLDERSALLFERGLVQETEALLRGGSSPDAKPLLSLGYKQAVAFLAGRLGLEDAIRDCQTKTRQYAKRQMTWFRSEPGVHWIPGFGIDTTVQERALGLTRDFLKRGQSQSTC